MGRGGAGAASGKCHALAGTWREREREEAQEVEEKSGVVREKFNEVFILYVRARMESTSQLLNFGLMVTDGIF